MEDLLFAYGILRGGREWHAELRRLGARFAGLGTVKAELFDLGTYPGARPSGHAGARLAGELYRLPNPEKALDVLDEVEGILPDAPQASPFRRELTEVMAPNGVNCKAWIYWLNRWRGPMRAIPTGDFLVR